MIKFDNDNMVIHEDLNRDEAIVFCKFLLAEQSRHYNDIKKINNTIRYLEDKHDIKIIQSLFKSIFKRYDKDFYKEKK